MFQNRTVDHEIVVTSYASSDGTLPSRNTDNWLGAFQQTVGSQFGNLVKTPVPVWRPRPLFNGRIAFSSWESDWRIWASTAWAWARFDWIEGFAVADATTDSRAARSAAEAMRMAGACRVLELFISRFDRRKARRFRRYPSEVKDPSSEG